MKAAGLGCSALGVVLAVFDRDYTPLAMWALYRTYYLDPLRPLAWSEGGQGVIGALSPAPAA